MTRTRSLLSHPAGPVAALVVSAVLILLRPGEPGTWVILVSSLAWLNAAFALRRSTDSLTPGEAARPAEAEPVSSSGARVIAAMTIGTLLGGLATQALGLLGAVVGGIIGAAAVVGMQMFQRRRTKQQDRDRGATLLEAAACGVSVAIALSFWWLLKG